MPLAWKYLTSGVAVFVSEAKCISNCILLEANSAAKLDSNTPLVAAAAIHSVPLPVSVSFRYLIWTVLDTLEFDTDVGQFPNIVHVSGDVFAIAYSGPLGDGWVCTFTIDSVGTIGNSVIDTLEFDTTSCIDPRILNISGDVYAVAYEAETNIEIATFTIDSSGNIGAATIDTFQSADSGASIEMGSFINVGTDYYAIAYNDNDLDGKVITIDIDSSGNIGAAEINTFEYDTSQGLYGQLINISGTMYAVVYNGPSNDGWVATFNISTVGVIDNITTDTFEYEATFATSPRVVAVTGDYYAIAYRASSNDGVVATITIDSDGNIGASVIDTLTFDSGGLSSIANNISLVDVGDDIPAGYSANYPLFGYC